MIEVSPLSVLLVATLMGLTLFATLALRRRERAREGLARKALRDVEGLGEVAPATRYPKIDPDLCVGSGACVQSCHEHALSVVDGRAVLVNPLGCVGHGVCAPACGFGAIELVYGTPKVAVELPQVNDHFETNQPGVYIVGELGGMGLIRNAVEQGRRAADHLSRGNRRGQGDALDAIVVGAGPAGISATLGLMKAGLRVLTVDREELGGTILHYPRAKVVMTGTLDLPLYGKVRRRVMSKEELIALWQDIQRKTHLQVATGELVTGISQDPDCMWSVTSTAGVRRTANVFLALGRRGSPRKLGVPGEEQAKVVYGVAEPEVFMGKHVLVVGGGNAAVESAIALMQHGNCASVSISYRRDKFARCRGDNRRLIEAAIQDGRAHGLLPSQVREVGTDRVALEQDGQRVTIANDAIVVQIGGTPPSKLLESFGINLVTKRGEA